MMKSILTIAIVLIILIGGAIHLNKQYKQSSQMAPTPTKALMPTSASADNELHKNLLASGVVDVPEEDHITVAFQGNETAEYGDFKNAPEKPHGTVTLGKTVVGSNDMMYTTIAVNSGGSGEFIYLAVFQPEEAVYNMKASAPLGDRIQIDSFEHHEDGVTVAYRVHGDDQAMVDRPNVSKTGTYTYTNGKLQEAK